MFSVKGNASDARHTTLPQPISRLRDANSAGTSERLTGESALKFFASCGLGSELFFTSIGKSAPFCSSSRSISFLSFVRGKNFSNPGVNSGFEKFSYTRIASIMRSFRWFATASFHAGYPGPGFLYSKSLSATSFSRMEGVMSSRAIATKSVPILGPIMLT